MPTPLTRQDIMAITDGVKNRVLDRLITRRDVQVVTDTARDRILNTINAFHVESQSLIRQHNNQGDQMWRRIMNLEAQITSTRQDIRSLTMAVNRLYEVQVQQMNRMMTRSAANPPESDGQL